MGDATLTSLSLDDVRRIARLAHLQLPEAEVERYAAELRAILDYVRQLDELDLEGIEPTTQVGEAPAGPDSLRADDPEPCLRRDLVLREAPRVSMAGFAVPAFADEG